MNFNANIQTQYKEYFSHPYSDWDFVIITAGNEKQRAYFEMRIMRSFSFLSCNQKTKFLSLCCEPYQSGSGCATLSAINSLVGLLPTNIPLSSQKILIIHSGGESRRLPMYAACGKVFSPFPHEISKMPTSLFDEILASFSSLSKIDCGCLVITTGDTLLMFDASDLSLSTDACTALSVSSDVQEGSKHGVFDADCHGILKAFYHKKSANYLLENIAENGNIMLDTGAYVFCGASINSLVKAAGEYKNIRPSCSSRLFSNFYVDFITAMALDSTLSDYLLLPREQGDLVLSQQLRSCLWNCLNKVILHVKVVHAHCIQLGTTLEIMNFRQNLCADFFLNDWKYSDSFLTSFVSNTHIGKNTVVENSILYNCSIGSGSMVSCITGTQLKVPENTILHGVRLCDGYCVLNLSAVSQADISDSSYESPAFPVCKTAQEAAQASLSSEKLPSVIRLASLKECCKASDAQYADETANRAYALSKTC